MVRDRLVRFGMPKAQAREVRRYLGGRHIATWHGYWQQIGFLELSARWQAPLERRLALLLSTAPADSTSTGRLRQGLDGDAHVVVQRCEPGVPVLPQLREGSVNEWMERGNCVSVDPELFFPHKGASVRQAKGVCRRCDVVSECLTWALATPGVGGVAGGATARERQRMRKTP